MHEEMDWTTRVSLGAAAGLAGTFLIQGLRSASEAYAPQTMDPVRQEPDEFMVEQLERPLPPRVRERVPQAVEMAVGAGLGIGYGVAFGAAYGALDRDGSNALLDGAALGLACWATGYLGWIPAAGLMEPVWRQQPAQALGPVVRHIAYGIGTVAAYQMMRRYARAQRDATEHRVAPMESRERQYEMAF